MKFRNYAGKEYRSENALNLTKDGMGIGLYTAKCICELNGISLKLDSEQNVIRRIKNIDYSKFNVEFWIEL